MISDVCYHECILIKTGLQLGHKSEIDCSRWFISSIVRITISAKMEFAMKFGSLDYASELE